MVNEKKNHIQGTVDIILLAAGTSQRYGPGNKLLATFRGRPLVWHTVQLARTAAFAQNTIFVYSDTAVLHAAEAPALLPVLNPSPQLGQGESVKLGVLHSSADFYLFLPADQPLLTPDILCRLAAARAKGRIVVPTVGGQPSAPTLFSADFRKELLSLAPGQPARLLQRRHAASVLPLPFAESTPFCDVDTSQDLQRMEHLVNSNKKAP